MHFNSHISADVIASLVVSPGSATLCKPHRTWFFPITSLVASFQAAAGFKGNMLQGIRQ